MRALALLSGLSLLLAQAPPPQTEAQSRPVFRGGTHFVRVDAYPIQNDTIVDGLKANDFEILEDGRPQTVDSLDFIRFDTYTPESERKNRSVPAGQLHRSRHRSARSVRSHVVEKQDQRACARKEDDGD